MAFVSKAVSDRTIITDYRCYYIKDGYVHATDDRVSAWAPIDCPYEYLLPAKEVNDLVARLQERGAVDVTFNEDSLKLSCGRYRGTIRSMLRQHDFPPVPQWQWQTIPDGFIDKLVTVSTFASTNAAHLWALGVYLCDGYAYATNNVVLAKIPMNTLGFKGIIPLWAIDFVRSNQGILDNIAFSDNYVAFQNAQHQYVFQSRLIDSPYPEPAVSILDITPDPGSMMKLTDPWREAYKTVASLSSVLTVYAGRIQGASDQAREVEAEIDTPVPDGHEYTRWDPRYFSAVVDACTYLDVTCYPKPAIFYNDQTNLIGVVCGRN